MKIYVVCEDYTCAFYGMTTNQQEAVEMAQEIGGFVHEWEMVDGKLTCVDELCTKGSSRGRGRNFNTVKC